MAERLLKNGNVAARMAKVAAKERVATKVAGVGGFRIGLERAA